MIPISDIALIVILANIFLDIILVDLILVTR